MSHPGVEHAQEADGAVFVVLSVASLEEDIYGHVQHVLPATLEAIIRFRGSIVALESELLAQAGTIGKPGQVAGEQVKEILSSYIGGEPDDPGRTQLTIQYARMESEESARAMGRACLHFDSRLRSLLHWARSAKSRIDNIA